MNSEPPPSYYPVLCQRFQSLVWSCLDSDLTKTAVFHAERYFALDRSNHESRHLYATALIREGQTYSALALVNGPQDEQCTGCLEIKAKCCTVLGRHRQARDALEATLRDNSYVSSASSSSRISHPFPEDAAIRCRAGTTALKGNLPEKASQSFKEALTKNPLLWEAFEGLCALGATPEIDVLFPSRLPPIKKAPPEEVQSKPTTTGVGFFTPEASNGGNLFRSFKPDLQQPQPFQMAPPPGPRDSIGTNDSSFYPDNSFQAHRNPRIQTQSTIPVLAVPRPLSSADEAGPVTKRLRSTSSQPEVLPPNPPPPTAAAQNLKSKPSKSNLDDPSMMKKARARPALSFANIFSSSSRRSQSTTSSRTNAAGAASGKSNNNVPPPAAAVATTGIATRRSTRLQSGTTVVKPLASKPQITRDRRRIATHTRNKSIESDKDDEGVVELAFTPSPPAAALTHHSEGSPSPTPWTAAQEQQAQEEYDTEMADYVIYDLVRRFVRATKALASYDCQRCLEELEQLPHAQQHSRWVIAMVARAHYERQDYASAERAFKTLRKVDPYRLWDMEIYSSLLWQLQNSVELSFLAQELLQISPRAPQAWIAIGNLFSLQKERAQALTCFRRAFQLDPACAYAYTLSGHESIDEDLEKAINFFQSALKADARHYNAWYGLGTCYLRMSKVRLAEYHFRKAVEIHPKNAVLLGCVGMANVYTDGSGVSPPLFYIVDVHRLPISAEMGVWDSQAVERRGDREAALSLFDEAVKIAPDNALVRYRRAKIFVSMRKYLDAVKDLEHLKNATPDESNVIFQLAKVYRLLGDAVKSAQALAAARDISPKSMNKIKKLLETTRDEGDDKMDEG
ncbi:hypothetical protein CPB83DRAFT_889998 [Crepidotus variabilis]|uniref:TPR-like protein n=1 Tax=Crepidotus variabilis TaxID=179855 RepID=A0A9P6ERF1_9AGAR|nr:hypothetical protein CPB83DRAFT_889998 [Crepidotus variabilis]